jgi:hypothetical protein
MLFRINFIGYAPFEISAALFYTILQISNIYTNGGLYNS